MTTLKKQTVSGVRWLVGSSFLQKAISFSATIVLARILTPSVFGLFALAFVAIDALGLFKSMGFDSALIRKNDDEDKAANTALFVIPVLGLCLYIVLSVLAPTIGRFFNNQELVSVVRALGIVFIISCFGKVPAALLEKNMQFKKVSIIEISSAVIYAFAAVALAVLGFGIWSLVIAYILKTLNQNILAWVFSGWHPKLEFDTKIALEMFHFGKFLFLGGVIWFLKMNLDNLLVGKILGTATLGLYAIAFNVANFGAEYFGSKVYQVMFPAYSKLQGDLYDLKSATLRTFRYCALFAIPLGMGLFFLSGEFLEFAYGSKWMGASDVLKILAFAGVFNTLPIPLQTAFLARGKSNLNLWLALVQVVLFITFIAPLCRIIGISGVGIVVGAASFTAFALTISWSTKVLSITPYELYLNARPALVSSLFMAIAIVILRQAIAFFDFKIIIYTKFAFISISSFLVYMLLLYKIEEQNFREMKELIS